MRRKLNFLKVVIILFLFGFLSCHSNQVYENSLIDYSDTVDANRAYGISITIFNRDIVSLKQNTMNAIIQNDGKMINERTENINTHDITVNIPKNKTIPFMENIKGLGVVIDESKTFHDISLPYVRMKNVLEDEKSMLEKYNTLLAEAITITDKMTLEREIVNAEREIENLEDSMKRIELTQEYNSVQIRIYNK